MSWLFDTSKFITRNHCGDWPLWMEYLYIISNILVAIAYFAIPFMAIILWKYKRNDVARGWILIIIAFFIFFCGLTHLADVLVFYWAPYRFYALIDFLTAIFSVLTVIYLPPVILHLLKLPSRELIHQLNNELQTLYNNERLNRINSEEQNNKLKKEIIELKYIVETNRWFNEKDKALNVLNEMLIKVEGGTSDE